jgi:hypothetical protein
MVDMVGVLSVHRAWDKMCKNLVHLIPLVIHYYYNCKMCCQQILELEYLSKQMQLRNKYTIRSFRHQHVRWAMSSVEEKVSE